MWVAEDDPWLANSTTLAAASRALTQACHDDDPFVSMLWKRRCALRMVHTAMVHEWPRRLDAAAAAAAASAAARRRPRQITLPGSACAGVEGLPHGAQLGVRLFFTLLESVSEPGCDIDEKQFFLDEVVTLLEDLPPLALAGQPSDCAASLLEEGEQPARPTQSAPPTPPAAHAFLHGHASLGVIDALRDFLFEASLPEASTMDPSLRVSIAQCLSSAKQAMPTDGDRSQCSPRDPWTAVLPQTERTKVRVTFLESAETFPPTSTERRLLGRGVRVVGCGVCGV